jgi:hypothetical protein
VQAASYYSLVSLNSAALLSEQKNTNKVRQMMATNKVEE